MITTLSICLSLSILFLVLSLYFNVKFSLIILKTQESIEESLDILDEKYQSMSKILDKPIFFDSIEVRQVINDIKGSRDAVLYVANSLGSIDEKAVEEIKISEESL